MEQTPSPDNIIEPFQAAAPDDHYQIDAALLQDAVALIARKSDKNPWEALCDFLETTVCNGEGQKKISKMAQHIQEMMDDAILCDCEEGEQYAYLIPRKSFDAVIQNLGAFGLVIEAHTPKEANFRFTREQLQAPIPLNALAIVFGRFEDRFLLIDKKLHENDGIAEVAKRQAPPPSQFRKIVMFNR